MKKILITKLSKADQILDELDKKILYHLDIDSRQSIVEIAKKVGANKDTVNFRIKKLSQNGIITRFSTVTDTARFGYENIKVYLQMQNFSKEVEDEFFAYLRSVPRIGWVAKTSGSWDILFCYFAKNKFEFYRVFIQILNKYSKYIQKKEVIHNINWFYYNRKWLLPEKKEVYPIRYGEEVGHEKLDDLDKEILWELIADAKKPIKDIALKADTSSQNVINRIKSLKKKGIITKFGIDFDYEKLGLVFCKTLIHLDQITEEKLKELYSYCASVPNIFALTTTLGAWDLELEFEVSRFKEMVDIMDNLKARFGIIRSYESIILTRQSEVIYIGE